MTELHLPGRYELLERLGKGGGGEVLAVRDRHTGTRLAFKVLADEASEREMAALVREAVALSGLEGLGVPRVVAFGRLPDNDRPYMVRELVEGRSLEELMDAKAELKQVAQGLVEAAEQLTALHRAGLLHGDVKPANVISREDGPATLVDLGLAAPWREGGTPAEGLTPRYAAPELLVGGSLSVRAEVYALGVTVLEAVESCADARVPEGALAELANVAQKATARLPADRYPSADEFASALRRAIQLPPREAELREAWPIVGIDGTFSALLEQVAGLPGGAGLHLEGPAGSGRSALLRRLAWSLAVQGRHAAWIDDEHVACEQAALDALSPTGSLDFVLVDDAECLPTSARDRLKDLSEKGVRLVFAGDARLHNAPRVFQVPRLERGAARDLVQRAVPALTERLVEALLERTGARPGPLRRAIATLAKQPIASLADLEHALDKAELAAVPGSPLERAVHFLDRGRFDDARQSLDLVDVHGSAHSQLAAAVARARLDLGLGEAAKAHETLERAKPLIQGADESLASQWHMYLGRALIGLGHFGKALQILASEVTVSEALASEQLAYRALALSFLGNDDEALAVLEHAKARATKAGGARIEAVVLASTGLVHQRSDRTQEARQAYEEAVLAAERAGDAGTLAMVRLNLAGLLKMSGELGQAIEQYESAVDMGRRSGRRATTRQALLNLANADLYLGRIARARAGIELLEEQSEGLPAMMRAQMLGLWAELLARSGEHQQAVEKYKACARAYDDLGRQPDVAEAWLECVLVASRVPTAEERSVRPLLDLGEKALSGVSAHRSLLELARSRVQRLASDPEAARQHLDAALSSARESGQREWVWRALEARAELAEALGQSVSARRDREEALAVLEDIGARLPRDLREVYWNDPRRRALRACVQRSVANAVTEFTPLEARRPAPVSPRSGKGTRQTISQLAPSTPLEQRLTRILEVNHELAGVLELDRLTGHIIDHAVALLGAERGLLLLCEEDDELSVHASRSAGGEDASVQFSRSIARSVIAQIQPIVSLSAEDDARMRSFASVHQLSLQSVACVPVCAPSGKAIGALYVETRLRPGTHFESELPGLMAFADQTAIAIENARLHGLNQRRTAELEATNQKLEAAQARLRELLDERTVKLKRARKRLRDARDTLYGHFGYQGLVGTSEAMRRVYALIERIKNTDIPVLITGESGTGKEMVARAIHSGSPRSKKKLLSVNCGAIPEHLLESELFGHVRGAFTGADRDRKGLFRDGAEGSLLLDEIGEMPAKMQSGLLRVLQERTIRPVGGTREEPVDVRVIFATNKDLFKLVEAGEFREDLYYRIHVVEVHLPPLRERREDIPQLVDHFLGIFAARYKRDKKMLTRAAMKRLAEYDWPGNVRQLENVLLNAWVLSERSELDAGSFDIPDGLQLSEVDEALPQPVPAETPPAAKLASAHAREPRPVSEHRSAEKERIIEALEACNWNRVKAAELSGIPRRTFYRRLKEYGIQ